MLLILSLIKLFYNTLILFYKVTFKHLNILSSFLLDHHSFLDHHSKSMDFLLFANNLPLFYDDQNMFKVHVASCNLETYKENS